MLFRRQRLWQFVPKRFAHHADGCRQVLRHLERDGTVQASGVDTDEVPLHDADVPSLSVALRQKDVTVALPGEGGGQHTTAKPSAERRSEAADQRDALLVDLVQVFGALLRLPHAGLEQHDRFDDGVGVLFEGGKMTQIVIQTQVLQPRA